MTFVTLKCPQGAGNLGGMGIHSHHSIEELQVMRQRLSASLIDRLTQPTTISHSGGATSRSIQFAQQTQEIRAELDKVVKEIDVRTGKAPVGGPIYLV